MKHIFVLTLPQFFPCHVGERKRAAISKQTFVSKKRVLSYIVLALEVLCRSLTLTMHVLTSNWAIYETKLQTFKIKWQQMVSFQMIVEI